MRLGYRIGCCRECASVVCVDEVPEEVLAALYSDPRYYNGGCPPYGYDGDFARYDAQKRPLWEERLGAIAAVTGGRRLLEIGPGKGGFSHLAASLGWDVMAVDPYPGSSLSVPVVASLDLAAASGPFDAICLFDVVEHLADPLGVLRQLPPLVAPRGCVAIASPNAAGASFRSLGFDWWELRPPEHLSIPSHEGIVVALRRAGLHLVRTVGHFRQTWHWPPLMNRLLEPPRPAGPVAPTVQLGLRVLNLVTREVRVRLPPPAPERQDYVTWLAQPRRDARHGAVTPVDVSHPAPSE